MNGHRPDRKTPMGGRGELWAMGPWVASLTAQEKTFSWREIGEFPETGLWSGLERPVPCFPQRGELETENETFDDGKDDWTLWRKRQCSYWTGPGRHRKPCGRCGVNRMSVHDPSGSRPIQDPGSVELGVGQDGLVEGTEWQEGVKTCK